jgi:ribosomal-protein-alanine N-acetyltransferase
MRKIGIMPTRTTPSGVVAQRPGGRVCLRVPRRTDAAAFLAAAKSSRKLHDGWVYPPLTPERFAAYVRRFGAGRGREPLAVTHAGFLVCRQDDDALLGVFNFSEIVRGAFQSAYLGYYAFVPHAGQGYMAEGLALALGVAFRGLKLHRVEVNVQPDNRASIALVRQAGFVREGFSRRYVRIGGRWRDHVRFALLAEDWRTRTRRGK